MSQLKRVVSGARPTGRLHMGNYFGSLKNWVQIQNSRQYDCYFFIADLHSLTTAYENPKDVGNRLFDMYCEMLAIGLDPEKSILFFQSQIPQHSELFLFFSMITPISWLERNPTVKDMIRDLDLKDNVNFGLIGYPVLQASDIALYKGDFVPIGKDQLPHLEITREIVRRFNYLYGETFPEPKELLTDIPILSGLDGKKMSKSLENTIYLTATEEEIDSCVKKAVTDPGRVYRQDKGHPEICNVYKYHALFSPEKQEELTVACQEATIGCAECKKNLKLTLNQFITPFRDKKDSLITSPETKNRLMEQLRINQQKAQEEALRVITEVKQLFHFEVFHE
ncbi:MAG: tryptophan--tRNA ligase [Caldisericia bacterium]|nr:tryptophan--tRNA ligase [Caldisericia bacterium]